MKKKISFALLGFMLFLCLINAIASTAAPEADMLKGVTVIDLREIIGEEAQDIEGAWMLDAERCVVARRLPEDRSYEVLILDLQNYEVLSRTPVPYVEFEHPHIYQGQYLDEPFLSGPDREDGVLHIFFESEDPSPNDAVDYHDIASWENHSLYYYIKASVMPNGTVEISELLPRNLTLMPGGQTAIREGNDGSLYAVDQATGEEELLIQGFSLREQTDREYEPFWDEQPEYYGDGSTHSLRNFYVMKLLDEHRFIYRVGSWEWDNGYGIYDLKTRTNHRITGRGYHFDTEGGWVFGESQKTDINTLESIPLPETVREQFAETNEWMVTYSVYQDISPNAKLLAVSGLKRRYEEFISYQTKERKPATITLTDIETGEILREYDIDNPLAKEYRVDFYENTRFMVFFRPEEDGAGFIYLFDVEAQ